MTSATDIKKRIFILKTASSGVGESQRTGESLSTPRIASSVTLRKSGTLRIKRFSPITEKACRTALTNWSRALNRAFRSLFCARDSQRDEGFSPDNSPHSRRLAMSSPSQHFCFLHKYTQYSLSHQKHCDVEFIRDPLAQW